MTLEWVHVEMLSNVKIIFDNQSSNIKNVKKVDLFKTMT